MKEFPRFVSKQIGSLFSVKQIFRMKTPVFLPFYHVVSDEKLAHVHNYPYRSVAEFEKELEFFLTNFKPVSLEELLVNQNKSRNVFHLSFDDGLRQCAEIIAPVLLKKGIPATFFVNTGFVDNKQLFHKYKASLIFNKLNVTKNIKAKKILADNGLTGNTILKVEMNQNTLLDEVADILKIDFKEFLKNEKPYMTTAQICKMQQDGFTVGAHSVDHPEFYRISDNQIIEQVKESMQWITETLNPKIKAFSFPFTDDGVAENVLKIIHKEKICDITFGTAGVKYDSWKNHFQRYPAELPGNFEQNLKGEYIYFLLRKLIGKATVTH